VGQLHHRPKSFFQKLEKFFREEGLVCMYISLPYPLLMGLLELCLGLPEALKMTPVYTNDFCYCSASLPQMKL